ncbi:hypothetical protein [Chitinophaga sp. Cy-1792]|uniref:hypothetical protein n=1 Tax=Chitinophaga sp. Cy-1792 TaxID=2608339 RepID=UPI00141FDEEC|nr:hypothetical protein [Chitinophaga sp. Cy-1792]NIG57406.1 hypothetical protein [Chitinophaga sp. Cy-1792]
MKKWLYSLPLVLVLFTASSCTKNYNDIIPNTTIVVDAAANQWIFDNTTGTYYISIDVGELTTSTTQSDAVVVSMSRNQTLFEALPEVYNNTSFTYIYKAGTVLIEAQGVNGAAIQLPTSSVRFKITIIPANTTR